MDQREFDAIRKYAMLTFGDRTISVKTCLACIEEDARDAGLTTLEYLDYIAMNGKLPE